MKNKTFREFQLSEKLSWNKYLNEIGIKPAAYKKLDPHEYKFFQKEYSKVTVAEFEQNFSEDLEDSAAKIKI